MKNKIGYIFSIITFIFLFVGFVCNILLFIKFIDVYNEIKANTGEFENKALGLLWIFYMVIGIVVLGLCSDNFSYHLKTRKENINFNKIMLILIGLIILTTIIIGIIMIILIKQIN